MELHSCYVAMLFVAILPITVAASNVEASYCANLSTSLPLAIAGRSRAEKRGPCSFWHPDPARQLVITPRGALEFTTHDGRFSLCSGDVLFTEDTVAGHDWKLLGDQPWRRLYAILDQVTVVPFRPVELR